MSDNNLPGGDQSLPPVPPVPPTPPVQPPVAPPAQPPAPSGWPDAQAATPGAPGVAGAYAAAPPAGGYPPQQPYVGAPLPPKPKGLALSAMIVGIVSLVLCAIPFIGILGGIAALVLGIIALKKAQSKGMSLTGIITGALAVVVAIVLLVVSLMFLGWATTSGNDALDSLEQQLEELDDTPLTPTPDPAPGTDDSTETGDDGTDSTGEWTSIAVISGNADQQTDTLKFSGDKIRITYDFADSSGLGTIVGAIYVLPEGTDLMTDGGIPEVTITKPGQGETLLRKDPGEYYVKVMAANSDYTVTVEEMD